MKILYFTIAKLEPKLTTAEGVHKKIYAQVEAMERLGHDLFLCYQRKEGGLTIEHRGQESLNINDSSIISMYSSVAEFASEVGINLCYIRKTNSYHEIYLTCKLRKTGIKVFYEIPTYPFISESAKGNKGFAKQLRKIKYHIKHRISGLFLNRIVTYSDDRKIWGAKTINISNGIDPDAIKLATPHRPEIFRITAVGMFAYWHGYDRLIEGVRLYKENGSADKQPILIRMVGGPRCSTEFRRLRNLVNKYNLTDMIQFTGELSGSALDNIFDDTDICVGSLGRHRSGHSNMKALKNVEYAYRGLPFCYSEENSDFDNCAFTLRIPPDETPVNVEELIDFVKGINLSPRAIRESLPDLSWDAQMRKVLNAY